MICIIYIVNNVYAQVDKQTIKDVCMKGKFDMPIEFQNLKIPYSMLVGVGYVLEELQDYANACIDDLGKSTEYGTFTDMQKAISNVHVILKGGTPSIIGDTEGETLKYIEPICIRLFGSISKKMGEYKEKFKDNTEDSVFYNIDISTYLKFKTFCDAKVLQIEKTISSQGSGFMETKKNDEYTRKILSKLGDIRNAIKKVNAKMQSLGNDIRHMTNTATSPTKEYNDIAK